MPPSPHTPLKLTIKNFAGSACTSDKSFTCQKIRKEVSYKTQQRKQGEEFKPTAKTAKRWNYELLSFQPGVNKRKWCLLLSAITTYLETIIRLC